MLANTLTITAAVGLQPGCSIDVRVEYDNGYIAYAIFRNGYRCYATATDTTVQWEERVRDQWSGRPESEIELSHALRKSMARAAHGGLVVCGARGIA